MLNVAARTAYFDFEAVEADEEALVVAVTTMSVVEDDDEQ